MDVRFIKMIANINNRILLTKVNSGLDSGLSYIY